GASGDAAPLIERIKELRLENGTIGLAGMRATYDGTSHALYTALQSAFPNAKLVDISDIFKDVRTCKSDEEVAMIERANLMFALAAERVYQQPRPGLTRNVLIQEGMRAMWDA